MATKKPAATAPLAHFAAKPISPLMESYVAWLKAETGYDVDPMSVQLSGVLRSTFQKSDGNQKRLAHAAEVKKIEAQTRAEKKAERDAKAKPVPRAQPKAKVAPKPRATRKGSTIATAEGVVIAEQRHMEAS